MKTVRLAFLLALLGSKAAFAAGSGSARAAGEGGAGASPILSGSIHEIISRLSALVAQYGLNLIGALAIFVVGRWVAKSVSSLLSKALTKAKVDATLVPFIENLAYTGMLVFIIIAALAKLGVQTASVVAVLGAAGLAVGLALQGSLANFASGVLLLVFKPFRVGDYVEISGVGGTVQAIHVFNTVLNDPNNIRVIVPNGQVTSGNILNYTINGTRRIDLTASVSYDDDLRKTRQVIESVLAAEPRILPDPAPVVAVKEMADSSVDFAVRPWVKVPDYWSVYFDLTEKLKTALEENGMTIPFTTQEIVVKTDTSAASVLKSA
ncbi:MAG: mechanosensitive ion channel [Planctomycetes bacterium]|nr:mechanosensitive ion channel [Planctomycetota bacterium]